MTSALVVLSGGQDSTTCLYWALKHFDEVRALSFRYGQRHVAEVEIAKGLCEEAGVPWECMDISFISQLSPSCSLTNPDLDIEAEKKESDPYPTTFVPGRNLFFLSVAVLQRLNYRRNMGVQQALDFESHAAAFRNRFAARQGHAFALSRLRPQRTLADAHFPV